MPSLVVNAADDPFLSPGCFPETGPYWVSGCSWKCPGTVAMWASCSGTLMVVTGPSGVPSTFSGGCSPRSLPLPLREACGLTAGSGGFLQQGLKVRPDIIQQQRLGFAGGVNAVVLHQAVAVVDSVEKKGNQGGIELV